MPMAKFILLIRMQSIIKNGKYTYVEILSSKSSYTTHVLRLEGYPAGLVGVERPYPTRQLRILGGIVEVQEFSMDQRLIARQIDNFPISTQHPGQRVALTGRFRHRVHDRVINAQHHATAHQLWPLCVEQRKIGWT